MFTYQTYSFKLNSVLLYIHSINTRHSFSYFSNRMLFLIQTWTQDKNSYFIISKDHPSSKQIGWLWFCWLARLVLAIWWGKRFWVWLDDDGRRGGGFWLAEEGVWGWTRQWWWMFTVGGVWTLWRGDVVIGNGCGDWGVWDGIARNL